MTQAARTLSAAAAVCLFALSCSEGPGAIPQGGVQFTTGSSAAAPDGTRCPTPGYTVSIGDPAPDMFSNDPGATLPDGVDGTQVSCRVRGRDTVAFSGSIRGANTTDGRTAELRFHDGNLDANGEGTVSVSISTPISSAAVGTVQLASQTPCTVTGVETGGDNHYGDGLLWARFVCSGMVSSGQPSNYCRTEGVVVLENCDR